MTPEEAYHECQSQKKRIFELEDIIASDSTYSFIYATNIIKGRFIKGEKIISKNPKISYHYAFEVLGGPFREGHPVIFNSEWKDEYIDYLKSIKCNLKKEIGEWLI